MRQKKDAPLRGIICDGPRIFEDSLMRNCETWGCFPPQGSGAVAWPDGRAIAMDCFHIPLLHCYFLATACMLPALSRIQLSLQVLDN